METNELDPPIKGHECSQTITSYQVAADSGFSKLYICFTVKSKEKRHACVCVCVARVRTATSDNRLAFVIAVPLVLISEQRLAALALVRPGPQGTRGGGENGCDDHKRSNYCHGDDFSQGESLTCERQKRTIVCFKSAFFFFFVKGKTEHRSKINYLAIRLRRSSRDFRGRS